MTGKEQNIKIQQPSDGMDRSIRDILKEQVKMHPSMQPTDVLKLCYQAAFGAEHLLVDREAASEYFNKEFQEVEAQEGQLYEWISPFLCRVNLGTWKYRELPGEWLFRMFVCSVGEGSGSGDILSNLEEAGREVDCGAFPFQSKDWQIACEEYQSKGIHPVHHSLEYRKQEHPSYRLVNSRFLRLLPILQEMRKYPEDSGVGIIALDGRCASGKTTLAHHLEAVTGAGMVHMDDFFLPIELRTPERLALPGGNVHYERFQQDILPYLKKQQAFTYTRFDCGKMQMAEKRQVSQSSWRIVEGAYSCHPYLKDYMNIRVFSDVEPDEQIRRIKVREGKDAVVNFTNRWIPMEEAYFREYQIEEKADIIL